MSLHVVMLLTALFPLILFLIPFEYLPVYLILLVGSWVIALTLKKRRITRKRKR